MTKYIAQCFDMSLKDSNCYLRGYFKIIDYRYENPSKNDYSERHHIVPKCWFRINGFGNGDRMENIVVLSPKEHLKVHVLLVHYFNSVNDVRMAQKMLDMIHRMTDIGYGDLKRCFGTYGDLPEEVYEGFQKSREMYYDSPESRIYSQRYIERCFSIYAEYDDMYRGFQAVVKEMGFGYSRQSLLDRFRKWIDKNRYNEVMKRQMRYWRESGGNLVNRYGSLDKCVEHLEEKEREDARKHLETVDKLKKMYDLYSLYGYKYMSVKYPGFHTSAFLEKCGRYGVIDYRPSKDTVKKEILYKGETHGINEWCDILGIRCRSRVYRIHSELGVDYGEIFRRYELDGGFGGFDIGSSRKDDVLRREDSLRRELLWISKCGHDCGYDYIRICDMHLSGMSVEDIREEVVRMSGRQV